MECLWVASMTQGSFLSRYIYAQTVVRRKPRKKVQVAIARKILVAVWFVFRENIPFK